ncbi:uncharacterized protein [Clinocottus analis]|uniref:uncharacterized protein n=1 Tax=Clinocottus analis TaxID=304258 RepID=UPI0035BF5BB1
MLLLYAAVACVWFGGSFSDVLYEEKCYGKSLTLPFYYTPPLFNGKLYFTPSNGGPRQLVMDKEEAKHPRLKVQIGLVKFTDLTERDAGTFSISNTNDGHKNVLKLTIKDCASKEMQFYGRIYSCDVPRQAEFLEFTPLHNVDQSKVLWNRTDPQTSKGGKGRLKRNKWEIKNLNQADMGHYNFRAKDHTLLSRILLEVREHQLDHTEKVNEQVFIQYPPGTAQWTVDFTPVGEEEKQRLMHDGNLLTEDEWSSVHFTKRIRVVHGGFKIDHLETIDSGTLEFRDSQGNLAQTVYLFVEPESGATTIVYVGIIAGSIFAVIACCCCVRKCCCKKSSSKRAEPAPQTAATPAVYYHDTNQPVGPSYSAAPAGDHSTHYSMNSLVSRERTTILLDPLVGPLGRQGVGPAPVLGSDWLSSDPEPTFELKGLSSALPLSSGSTFCDVYNSDKLNFL